MSDVYDPKKYPELAAQQVLIEFIRAGKVGAGSSGNDASKAISVFESLKEHYLKDAKRPSGALG